jgi:DNA-binding NarL/FixJ family response regulator
MTRPGKMRVLIADRHAATRSALRILLKEEPGLNVVGEAADGGELLAQVGATRPDIVVLDWELPGEEAAVLVPSLHTHDGRPSVVVLGGRPELAQAALAAGADAFVSKGDPPQRLLDTIHAIESEGGRESQPGCCDP